MFGLLLEVSDILRDKTMDNKLKHIPNDDKQNCPFCRLLVKKLIKHY